MVATVGPSPSGPPASPPAAATAATANPTAPAAAAGDWSLEAAAFAASSARLRLLDMRAAKDVAWVTDGYAALAAAAPAAAQDAVGGGLAGGGGEGDGGSGSARLVVPSVTLGPGRYLVLLEIDPASLPPTVARAAAPGAPAAAGGGPPGAGDGQGAVRAAAQQPAAGLAWQLQLLPSADEKVGRVPYLCSSRHCAAI